MRDPGEPTYPIYDQDDPEKLRNELLLSFFGPVLLTIGVLAVAFRLVVGDVLAGFHPAFAEPIEWGAGPYSKRAGGPRMLLLIGLTCLVTFVYFRAYLTYFRDWFRERGWV